MFLRTTSLAVALIGLACLMPDAFSQNVVSPDVQDDGRVIFRLRAPNAEQVSIRVAGQTVAMTETQGVWTGEVSNLPAGIHDYTFEADGTRMVDPSNRNVKKWLNIVSMVEIPGEPSLLTELQAVPHGERRLVYYDSAATQSQRPAVVYLPPNYSETEHPLPLLILCHGYGDDETAWTEVGRTHFIVDNLIAEQKIRPLVIVMPWGHPEPLDISQRPDDYFLTNNLKMEQDVRESLLPFVESRFNAGGVRERRFIAGLSMGGGHAIDTGLKNTDLFSAIGAFSAAAPQGDSAALQTTYDSLTGNAPTANTLTTFWIPIGTSDFLLNRNRQFTERLNELGIRFQYEETDGGHSWDVWRRYLPEFLEKVVPLEPSN